MEAYFPGAEFFGRNYRPNTGNAEPATKTRAGASRRRWDVLFRAARRAKRLLGLNSITRQPPLVALEPHDEDVVISREGMAQATTFLARGRKSERDSMLKSLAKSTFGLFGLEVQPHTLAPGRGAMPFHADMEPEIS